MSKAPWRKLFLYARYIHIYISTLLFALLIFFCVTGVTLNHRWYGAQPGSHVESFALTLNQMQDWALLTEPEAPWQPDLNLIREFAMQKWQLPSPHSINIDDELYEIALDFKVPAGFANITIVSEEQRLYLEREQGAMLGVINDLHKGRHSGSVWFWLIDISAGLMVLFALSGFIILYQGKKHRRSGTWLAIIGLATPLLIFLFYVPHLGG